VRGVGATVTEAQIFVGVGLTVALAVGCQVVADRHQLPAIILLLPAGFLAGAVTSTVNPDDLFGATFGPMVDLAVAIILFEGGLDLVFTELEGHSQRVVRRLLYLGIPITWAAAATLSWTLLGLTREAAIMLGAILIVSGPTVVTPLLRLARPGARLTTILGWEGTTIDPIGAIVGALMFQAIQSGAAVRPGRALLHFGQSIGVGVVGGIVGTAVIWLVLRRLRVSGWLATEVLLAVVVAIAAACNAYRTNTGLIAAIVMGVALANIEGFEHAEHRRFFRTVVQLVIGLLFISISATVTPTSVSRVLWPTLAVVLCLVLVVRPLIAVVATIGTNLSTSERAFIGWMDPRGIVAASTAATFGGALAGMNIPGADALLPATFVVIAGTVAIYGLSAVPAARLLGLANDDSGDTGPVVPGDAMQEDP
jgi:NhaP-type Na+/H+ or K+/H+ antiporter